jgi:hypothetical protein
MPNSKLFLPNVPVKPLALAMGMQGNSFDSVLVLSLRYATMSSIINIWDTKVKIISFIRANTILYGARSTEERYLLGMWQTG